MPGLFPSPLAWAGCRRTRPSIRATFVVDGAPPAGSALTTASAEMKFVNGISLAATAGSQGALGTKRESGRVRVAARSVLRRSGLPLSGRNLRWSERQQMAAVRTSPIRVASCDADPAESRGQPSKRAAQECLGALFDRCAVGHVPWAISTFSAGHAKMRCRDSRAARRLVKATRNLRGTDGSGPTMRSSFAAVRLGDRSDLAEPQRHPGNPEAPSQITTWRLRAIRFTCCDGCP